MAAQEGYTGDSFGTSESLAPQPMAAGTYIKTRLTTLKPAFDKAPNPIRLLRMLNRQQWAFFSVKPLKFSE